MKFSTNDFSIAVHERALHDVVEAPKLILSATEEHYQQSMHPNLQQDWYLSRMALATLLDTNALEYHKDDKNKPWLLNDERHISFSHTRGYGAAMLSQRHCGLDIQVHTDKIQRIKHKFVNDFEEAQLGNFDSENLALLWIWSAKEAAFKAYGEKEVDYRLMLFVTLPTQPHMNQWLKGQIRMEKNGHVSLYETHFYANESYVLVASVLV